MQISGILLPGLIAAVAMATTASGQETQLMDEWGGALRDRVSCLIEPERIVRLSTPVAGIVAEVSVDRGDTVRAGQEVARLDTEIEELTLAIAEVRAEDRSEIQALEARIEFLQEQAERNEQLAARDAVSDTAAAEARLEAVIAERELDQARLAHRLAALEARQARAAVEQRILRSPVDGVVTERLLNPGEYREGESHIATIARLDPLRVEAFVPIALFDRIALGQQLQVIPEAPLDTPLTAAVTVIDRVFDAATATFGVRLALENDDLSLPAGLRCDLLLPGGQD
jgi:RND family efflux transporter MFP subunit